jgi:hypothetical protein
MTSFVEHAAKDLVEAGAVLLKDVAFARSQLDHQPEQFWRRQYIRACFAFIECNVSNLKRLIYALHESDALSIGLGELVLIKEEAWNVDNHGTAVKAKQKISILKNIRFTLDMITKHVAKDFMADYSDARWEKLTKSVGIRNRITHPRSPEDTQVDDSELNDMKGAMSWVWHTFAKAVRATAKPV